MYFPTIVTPRLAKVKSRLSVCTNTLKNTHTHLFPGARPPRDCSSCRHTQSGWPRQGACLLGHPPDEQPWPAQHAFQSMHIFASITSSKHRLLPAELVHHAALHMHACTRACKSEHAHVCINDIFQTYSVACTCIHACVHAHIINIFVCKALIRQACAVRKLSCTSTSFVLKLCCACT